MLALASQTHSKVDDAGDGVRVLKAKFPPQLQNLAPHGLSCCMMALAVKTCIEVADAGEGVRVIKANHPLARLNGFLHADCSLAVKQFKQTWGIGQP
jgi:hypothetical protein